MRIPRRLGLYLVKQFFLPFLIVSVLFTFINIMYDFVQNSTRFTSAGMTFPTIMTYYAYWMPKMTFQLFPISVLFAVIFVVSTMNHDNELLAAYASGLSTFQVTSLLLVTVIVLTMVFLGTQDIWVTPQWQKKAAMDKFYFHTNVVKDNFNIKLKGTKDVLYLVQQFKEREGTLTGIHVIQFNRDVGMVKEIFAQTGTYDKKTKIWTYYDVIEVVYTNGVIQTNKMTEKVYNFPEGPDFFSRDVVDMDAMTLKAAYTYLQMLRKYSIHSFIDEHLFWTRLSLPFSGIIISIFGIVAGAYFRRNTLVSSLLVCLVVFAVYYFTVNLFFNLGKRGIGSPIFSSWVGNIMFTVLGGISISKIRS